MTGDEAATIHLDTPSPGASSGLPAGSGEQPSNACAAATRLRPSWPCFGWGLPSHSGHPECWCALTAPFHPYHPPERVAVCSLWHFPASRLGLPLAITLLCEVRTFLESQSRLGPAAARPTRPRRSPYSYPHAAGATGSLSAPRQGPGRRPIRRADHRGRPGRRGRPVPRALLPHVHPYVRRITAGLPADPSTGAGRGIAALYRSFGRRHLRDGRPAERRVLHDHLRPGLREAARGLPRQPAAGSQPRQGAELHPEARHHDRPRTAASRQHTGRRRCVDDRP